MGIHDFAALARLWRELEEAGIPLDPLESRIGVDNRGPGSGLTIRRGGRNAWSSEIKELKDGRFAYILPVFIRRDRPGKTIIRDCWIDAPWPGATIELLEDPRAEERKWRHPHYYQFPGDPEHFFREQVLNHRIEQRQLSRGNTCEGQVLAMGCFVPEAYGDHQKIEIMFGILDQWDAEIVTKMEMRLNRGPAREKKIPKPTRSPLLSKPDVIVQEPGWNGARPAPNEDPQKTAEEVERAYQALAAIMKK